MAEAAGPCHFPVLSRRIVTVAAVREVPIDAGGIEIGGIPDPGVKAHVKMRLRLSVCCGRLQCPLRFPAGMLGHYLSDGRPAVTIDFIRLYRECSARSRTFVAASRCRNPIPFHAYNFKS